MASLSAGTTYATKTSDPRALYEDVISPPASHGTCSADVAKSNVAQWCRTLCLACMLCCQIPFGIEVVMVSVWGSALVYGSACPDATAALLLLLAVVVAIVDYGKYS